MIKMAEIDECFKCEKVTEVFETPSGWCVCKDCWKKYKVDGTRHFSAEEGYACYLEGGAE